MNKYLSNIAKIVRGTFSVVLMASTVAAQEPVLAPVLTTSKGQHRIQEFVKSVTGNDVSMEVTVGQGKLLTLREKLATEEEGGAVIAVGDPSILDFEVIGLKQIRLIGQRIGTTDLSVTTADSTNYAFEINVVADLRTLQARLKAFFPDSSVEVTQIADHVVVEGQARSTAQIEQIMQTVGAWMTSLQNSQARRVSGKQQATELGATANGTPRGTVEEQDAITQMRPDLQISGSIPEPEIINLMTVPGSQQVMLKVQIAELNRTGLRRFGSSLLLSDGASSTGTNPTGTNTGFPFFGGPNATTTLAGVVSDGGGSLNYFIDALRRNSILKILAEPTLVAYNGHEATFLAGGEFPVPIPQNTTGGNSSVTVEFREFGVRLGFLPNIMEDDLIRLTVNPEVSSIDRSLGTVLVAGGTPVPGLNTRKSSTTVEMRSGQTLAMAGLLQITLDNETNRIPGIGDLPILGPFFSNNTGERTEKELIVMVTPFLVEATDSADCNFLPGQEINEPNDLEFFLLGRIESRTGRDFRSTTKWDDPLHLVRKMKLHQRYVSGPSGFSE